MQEKNEVNPLWAEADHRQSSAAPLSSFRRWYLVFTVLFIGMSAQVDRHVMPMLATRMKASFLFSDEQMGALLGFGFSATFAACAIFMGYFGDRFSRKWVLLVSVCVFSVLTGFCAFAKTFAVMLAARLGVGAAESALAPTGFPMVSSAFPSESRALPVSLASAGSPFGLILAPILVGTIVHEVGDRTLTLASWLPGLQGWQFAFLACAALGLIALGFLAMAREPAEPAITEGLALSIPEALRHFVSHKRYFGGLFLCLPLLSTGNYALIAWMPSYLERTFSLDLQHIGVLQSIGFVPAAVVAPLIAAAIGRYSERSGKPTMPFRIMLAFAPVVGTLTALPLLMPTGLSASIAFAFPVCATSITISFQMINIQTMVAPRYRAQATAIGFSSFLLLGSGLGPTVAGVLTTRVFGEHALGLAVLTCLGVFVPLSALMGYLALRDTRGRLGTERGASR
jgi:MFS family permease